MRSDTERSSRQSPIAGKLTLVLPARAKLNLDLRVIRALPDGYHEIVTTMQTIGLHDLLEISSAADTSLSTGGLKVPAGPENAVLKAQRALQRAVGHDLPAQFVLHKRIPPGSGFGGASSDAAAALTGLKALYRLEVDLMQVATDVGADVPFFVRGGCARAEGRGERLTSLETEHTWFALAWPRIELSTAAVYRAWDEVSGEGVNELRRAAERVEPRVADFAQKLGAGWEMTGSGSAFYKPCESQDEAESVVAPIDQAWTVVTFAVGAST